MFGLHVTQHIVVVVVLFLAHWTLLHVSHSVRSGAGNVVHLNVVIGLFEEYLVATLAAVLRLEMRLIDVLQIDGLCLELLAAGVANDVYNAVQVVEMSSADG